MSDIDKARRLFQDEGLTFPTIPEDLAPRLKEQDKWLFSTRDIEVSPYNLDHYLDELKEAPVQNYAILSHSGHGVNSYAIQYYLVHGNLRMFLFLGWGGIYSDRAKDTAHIGECFLLADQIVAAMKTTRRLQHDDTLMIKASNFYGSRWSATGARGRNEETNSIRPAEVLAKVLHWLKSTSN